MKAYLVLDFSINDLAGFREYIDEIPAFIARHQGKYIVRGVEPTAVIQDLFKVRHDTTTSKLVLVDGCT